MAREILFKAKRKDNGEKVISMKEILGNNLQHFLTMKLMEIAHTKAIDMRYGKYQMMYLMQCAI